MIINMFSLRETSVLKAISIICIVLHNALHPIYRPFKVCNEFDFSISRIQFFWETVSGNIYSLPNCILMAFGYSGVAFFFFFSAYGLAFKFGKGDAVPYWSFVKTRLIKIYIPILLSTAFLLLFVFTIGQYGTQERLTPYHLFLQLATLINFTSSYSAVIVGPWWFLGAIIQLYLTFHLLMWGRSTFGNHFLLFISIASMIVLMLYNNPLSEYIYLKKNIIGWLPEVALGIYFALGKKIDISNLQATVLAVALLCLYIFGNIYEFFWYFSSLAILIFSIIVSHPILSFVRKLKKLEQLLIYTGKISVYMFLVNGIIREPIVALYNKPESPVWVHSISACVILILSFVAGAILMRIQEWAALALTRGSAPAA